MVASYIVARQVEQIVSVVEELLKESGSGVLVERVSQGDLGSDSLVADAAEAEHLDLALLLRLLLLWLDGLSLVLGLTLLNHVDLHLNAAILVVILSEVFYLRLFAVLARLGSFLNQISEELANSLIPRLLNIIPLIELQLFLLWTATNFVSELLYFLFSGLLVIQKLLLRYGSLRGQ